MTKVPQNNLNKKSKCVRTYRFLYSQKNPSWSLDKLIPLRSCLIRNNDEKVIFGDLITTIPKRLTTLEVTKEDLETGEISTYEHYTNDFKASANRRNKALKEFCGYYEPLYRIKEVSVLFFTFTRWEFAKRDMRSMVDMVMKRLEALKWPVRGWLWCLELKKNDNMEFGWHIHYHLVVATDRVKVKKIPDELKLEGLWGQRTDVEFVKYSVKNYLNKEMNKSNSAKLIGRRTYSRSRKFI